MLKRSLLFTGTPALLLFLLKWKKKSLIPLKMKGENHYIYIGIILSNTEINGKNCG